VPGLEEATSRTALRSGAFALSITLLIAGRAPTPAGDGAVARYEPAVSVDQVSDTASDTVRLRLDAPEAMPPGAPVPIVLRVENVTGRPLELHLRGRTIAFDLVVSDLEGSVVWRRLHEAIIPAILRLESLEPEGTLELFDSWSQRSNDGDPVEPGLYTVRGELLTDGAPLVTPEHELIIR
jgi:hypothetical protein